MDKLQEFEELANAVKELDSPYLRVRQIGKSGHGEPIYAYFATPANREFNQTKLVIGTQHGDEPAGCQTLKQIIQEYIRNPAKLREDVDQQRLILVPLVNPDGYQKDTRQTPKGVDLNRWHGTSKTPENRAIRKLIQTHKIELAVDLHEYHRDPDTLQQTMLVDACIMTPVHGYANPWHQRQSHYIKEQILEPLLRKHKHTYNDFLDRVDLKPQPEEEERVFYHYVATHNVIPITIETRKPSKDNNQELDKRIQIQKLALQRLININVNDIPHNYADDKNFNLPEKELNEFLLREPRYTDWRAFREILNDDTSRKYSTYGYMNDEAIRTWLNNIIREYNTGGPGAWVVQHKKTGQIIGIRGVRGFNHIHRRGSTFTYIHPDYRGQGLGSQLTKLFFKTIFEELKINRLEATVHPDNIASQKHLEKIGYQREGFMKEGWYNFETKQYQDMIVYGMVASQYKTKHQTKN